MVTQVLNNLHNLVLPISGVFGVNDVVELLNKGQYKLQIFTMQYLVIAGGGGGGGPSGNSSGRWWWCKVSNRG